VKAHDHLGNPITTRMWNPIMYAVYFRQLKILQFYASELKVNMRLACNKPETSNEYLEESKVLKELIED
jgi:hypothetical protein